MNALACRGRDLCRSLGLIVLMLLAVPHGGAAQLVVSGCGTIEGNVVWGAERVYVLDHCTVVVSAGSSLTIGPGAVVKVAGSHDRIVVDGSLAIEGTSTTPAVVTSLRDDSVGGDTNGDGSASAPAPGDWGWIVFHPASRGSIRNADIAFGGVGSHGYTEWAMVKVYGPADVGIDQSTLRQSWNDGLFAGNASVGVTRSRVVDHGAHGLNYQGLDPAVALLLRDNVFSTPRGDTVAARIGFGANPTNVRVVGNQAAGSGWNGIRIEGRIDTDLALDGDPGLPFLLPTSLTVAPSATLQVSPAAVFKAQGCGPKLVVEGRWVAAGESTATIVFTSLRDDFVAGDTNGDGGASAPAAADWGYVRLSEGAEGTLAHSTLRYGGVACSGYDNYSMLQARSAALTLSDTTLESSYGSGLYGENARLSVQRSHFLDAGRFAGSAGLEINGLDPNAPFDVRDSVFETRAAYQTAGRFAFGPHPGKMVFDGNTGGGNGRNGFVLGGTVQHDLSLDVVDSVPFVIDGGLGVAAEAVLTLTPGTHIKLAGCGRKLAVDGALIARGNDAEPIVFTSLADDAHGGDTNGDGAATTAQASDWGYLGFGPGSTGTLEHVFVGYGGIGCSGYDLYTLLAADDAIVDVTHADFAAYRWNAVYGNEARLRIQRSRFPADLPDRPMAIRNAGHTLWIDARHNWWGDASGPHHPTRNPDGAGAPVTDLVRFLPWAVDASGAETTQLLVEGPSRVSPGDTAAYFVDYFAGRALDDAVLVVALPANASFVPGSATGVYRADRHELFWRLGSLAAGAEGRLPFELTHAWGQGGNSEANVAGLLLASGLPGALAADSYLAWDDDTIEGRTSMSAAELAAERDDHPDLDQVLADLADEGFVVADAERLRWTSGAMLAKVALVDAARNAIAIVDRNADGATAVASYPQSVVLRDASGFAAVALDDFALSLGGTWGGAAMRAAPTGTASFSDCMSNCIADNKAAFLSRTRAKLSSIAACRRWLWDGIATAESDCLESLTRLPWAVLDIRNSLDLSGCLGECSVDPRLHYCVEDQVYCYPDIGLGTGSWVHTCDTATGKLRRAKFERCAAGEPCIQSVGCYARAVAAGRVGGKLSTAVRLPRDPNAKLGRAGDVLPGEELTYTVTWENEGAGRAYGVYVRDDLGPEFDVDTLDLMGAGEFVAATRRILWEVGELAPKGEDGSKGQQSFRIRLRPDLSEGTVVANQAVVFFPSAPEELATNTVVNVVAPLVGVPQQLETEASVPVAITLAGGSTSAGPLSFAIDEYVLNGELGGVAPNLTYTPAPGFTGLDRFTFVVDDGTRRSRPAAVTIVVAPSASDATAPWLLWTWPDADAVVGEVAEETADGETYAPFVRVGFSEAMDPETVTEAGLTLVDDRGAAVPVRVRWDAGANEAEVAPQQPWRDGMYTVTVGAAVQDAAGNALAADHVWRFHIAAGAGSCAGDCNRDGAVTVDELIVGVSIALGTVPAAQCPAMDTSGEGQVTVDELIAAVTMALVGCG